jgi:2-succinyl-5-enolpyruvyl-6-hydroxy-3-cyclohexene-1-carboxylate synthase
MHDDPTYAGLEAFVVELVRAGMEHVCIMPGARSTPLALTLATQPGVRAWSHIDERSGAFFALGIAKATGRPVAVVCTSGTAAANLLPAAIEAFYAHVPLLLLTADRPPELRDCGAAQTIDQIKLYGAHVKWFTEGAMADAGPRYFRTLACQAVARACAAPAGPVHLNFPFREPLMPALGSPAIAATDARAADGPSRPSTLVCNVIASPPERAVQTLAAELAATSRGLIACGPQDGAVDFPAAVVGLAEIIGYPVLADPTSQVRSGAHDTSLVVDAYDALFRDETSARRFSPDVVLRFGPLPTSKAFATFLQQNPACRQIVVDPLTPWSDPTSTAAELLPWDPVVTCGALSRHLGNTIDRSGNSWRTEWLTAAHRARQAIEGHLDSRGCCLTAPVSTPATACPSATWRPSGRRGRGASVFSATAASMGSTGSSPAGWAQRSASIRW